ncbi:helix-turn-helix transcriptional regulator [Clostridium sp. E02]|uniref:helix-turn-helix domain-containing protein n=1 Tax=Clostridium sp. E02 TaxID=2487134 RepID=UPI000F5462A4|nr:helix-turn-helix transcriptional regulator [Clostridium sp. E02]
MSITGQRIKERRKQLELSADDVADLLGVSRSTIFRYESGHIEKVPANVLERLAEILNTTPAYLMGWKDDDTYPHHTADYTKWQKDSSGEKNGIFIRESSDGCYHSDGCVYIPDDKMIPSDRTKVSDIIDRYLSLTDKGKKKAYDYITDLSEQSKYKRQN